jgi:hypothetical protein
MDDWWNQPTKPQPDPVETAAEPQQTCPWCAAPAVASAFHCVSCGAMLAQREDLGGLLIPGVTAVDPAMQAHGTTSTLIGSQSRMSAINVLGSMGGIGGTTAQMVAATAILVRDGMQGTGPVDPEQVGKPSQAALEMVRRMRDTEAEAASTTLEAPPAQTDETDSAV